MNKKGSSLQLLAVDIMKVCFHVNDGAVCLCRIRHLYYTDWGSRAAVMRVNLDGSEPQALRIGLDNPNSVIVIDGQVYYVDSHYKKLDNTFSGLFAVSFQSHYNVLYAGNLLV